MTGDCENTTLAGVATDVSYGYTESASDERVGPRFLRITDIQNGVADWHKVPYCPISESNHRKYRLHYGDIVVARTGNSTGENYLYRGSEDAVYASYLIRFRVDQRTADPAFVWYNLRTQRWQDFISSSKTGSAQAGANVMVLGGFPLTLPPIPEQRTIAAVLGTLDDKIELNRQVSATLEVQVLGPCLVHHRLMRGTDGRDDEAVDGGRAGDDYGDQYPESRQPAGTAQCLLDVGEQALEAITVHQSRLREQHRVRLGQDPLANLRYSPAYELLEPRRAERLRSARRGSPVPPAKLSIAHTGHCVHGPPGIAV